MKAKHIIRMARMGLWSIYFSLILTAENVPTFFVIIGFSLIVDALFMALFALEESG